MEKHYEHVVGLRVCAIGRADEIERFCIGLPGLEKALDEGPLWHQAKIKVRNPGFLCVAASRRGEARRADGLRGPGLTFVGTLNADTDPDRLYSFDGRCGETTWREMAIDPTGDQMVPADRIKEKTMVQRQIAESPKSAR
jgi:hypothetical protein